MADPIDLTEVAVLQAELLALVARMTSEADTGLQQALVKQVTECSDRLARVCGVLEERARAIARQVTGHIEVVLTPDQRAEVRRRFGIEMETVLIEDHGGGLVAAMPRMGRRQILTLALAEAEARSAQEQAQRAAQAELDRVSGELRRDAPEQIKKEIDRLLQDPNFRRAFEPRRGAQK